MGSTPVGGSENSFSEYFDLGTLFTLYPSHQSIYHMIYSQVQFVYHCVCFLFLIKLRCPKNKSIYDTVSVKFSK